MQRLRQSRALADFLKFIDSFLGEGYRSFTGLDGFLNFTETGNRRWLAQGCQASCFGSRVVTTHRPEFWRPAREAMLLSRDLSAGLLAGLADAAAVRGHRESTEPAGLQEPEPGASPWRGYRERNLRDLRRRRSVVPHQRRRLPKPPLDRAFPGYRTTNRKGSIGCRQ